MNYLHAAVIEDFEECFISANEEDLRDQVNSFLDNKTITPPSDAEWAVCILAKTEEDIPHQHLVAGSISYYKIDASLQRKKIIAKLLAMKGN